MHSNRSSSPSSTSMELEEPLGESQVGADSTTERAAEIYETDISGCEKHREKTTRASVLSEPSRWERKVERKMKCFRTSHTSTPTCENFDNHGPLLLDDVPVGEAGVAAVVGHGVVDEDVGEVQVSVHAHGHPAVLWHRLHGGESRLDGPVERSGERACSSTKVCFSRRQLATSRSLFVRHTHSWTSSRSLVSVGPAGGRRTAPVAARR